MAIITQEEDGVRTEYTAREIGVEVVDNYGDTALSFFCPHCNRGVMFGFPDGRTVLDCQCKNREWWIDFSVVSFAHGEVKI